MNIAQQQQEDFSHHRHHGSISEKNRPRAVRQTTHATWKRFSQSIAWPFRLLHYFHPFWEDPWPVLVLLAQYFKSGAFQESPRLQYSAISDYPEVYQTEVRRAVNGSGIVALHHLLTLYAIEKSRHFFQHHEYNHMLTMWTHMMTDKTENLCPVEDFAPARLQDFNHFYGIFYNRILFWF